MSTEKKYKDNYDYPNSVFYEKNDEIERLRSEIKHGCINCANDVDTTIKELEIEIQSLRKLIVKARREEIEEWLELTKNMKVKDV